MSWIYSKVLFSIVISLIYIFPSITILFVDSFKIVSRKRRMKMNMLLILVLDSMKFKITPAIGRLIINKNA